MGISSTYESFFISSIFGVFIFITVDIVIKKVPLT
jgi:hypothetical protein